jgi:hypothetical protein
MHEKGTTRSCRHASVPPKRQPSLASGFAGFATALATLLLFAVIGVNLITQSGGSMTASAPSE